MKIVVWRKARKNAPAIHTRLPLDLFRRYEKDMLYLKRKWYCKTIGHTIFTAVTEMARQEREKEDS